MDKSSKRLIAPGPRQSVKKTAVNKKMSKTSKVCEKSGKEAIISKQLECSKIDISVITKSSPSLQHKATSEYLSKYSS